MNFRVAVVVQYEIFGEKNFYFVFTKSKLRGIDQASKEEED